jgi:hypothetical protein
MDGVTTLIPVSLVTVIIVVMKMATMTAVWIMTATMIIVVVTMITTALRIVMMTFSVIFKKEVRYA